jgi:hypothetical protein
MLVQALLLRALGAGGKLCVALHARRVKRAELKIRPSEFVTRTSLQLHVSHIAGFLQG